MPRLTDLPAGLGHLQLALDFLPPDEIKPWKASRRARPRLVGHCKVGHLFPVASVDRPDYPRFLERLTGIKIPYNSASRVDDPRNGIVLDGTLNSLYATLDLAFKATGKVSWSLGLLGRLSTISTVTIVFLASWLTHLRLTGKRIRHRLFRRMERDARLSAKLHI